MGEYRSFPEFFEKATGNRPFPYQCQLAQRHYDVVEVPTGLGKTAAAILAWLWRRHGGSSEQRLSAPRRLVYCLPMRVLVEQTLASARGWLDRLGLADKVGVFQLMGGDTEDEWQRFPEHDAILVGTQDMLLSRALNRGYAMSRFMWPMAFGLLHNDALWVFDEVQLMGSGLATTAQLEGLRRDLGTATPCGSLWMSATLENTWLDTVDFRRHLSSLQTLRLDAADRDTPTVQKRAQAVKRIAAPGPSYSKKQSKVYMKDLAARIAQEHQAKSLTLVILNTVERACGVYDALTKEKGLGAELLLLHSRFRPRDRQSQIARLAEPLPAQGRIVISTQVVEAGVDISAQHLFTELAPWASLVQRLGRCNRRGEYASASVIICDISPEEDKDALPYAAADLAVAREHLVQHEDLGPAKLNKLSLPFEHGLVLRRRDLLELFDTTADLSGADIDIAPYIRETDDHDVQVFWRELADNKQPPEDAPQPARDELCSVSIGDFGQWFKKIGSAWLWDTLAEAWVRLETPALRPGLTLMLPAAAGGYEPSRGWVGPSAKDAVATLPPGNASEGFTSDPLSIREEATLAQHTARVVAEMETILATLQPNAALVEALRPAARFHDVGKAHAVFQYTMYGGVEPKEGAALLAKSKHQGVRHQRRGFRHELASGLALLQAGYPDLVVYLVAGHHGRVRLAIRSRPDESTPNAHHQAGTELSPVRVALGVWDGDQLPAVDLGATAPFPQTTLDLSVMELGQGPLGLSWLARMLALRDAADLGPFRLAFAEALLRAADHRGSEVH